MLLGQLLHLSGIDTVILERQSCDYVKSRIRAGVLEDGTCKLLEKAGLGKRLRSEGIVHNGTFIATAGRQFRIDFQKYTSKYVTIYGQTEVTRDLYEARELNGRPIIDEAKDAMPCDVTKKAPYVTYNKYGSTHRIDCDFVVGCDGFHGITRQIIPKDVRSEYGKVYPFGWLGVLSQTPPVSNELIYANSLRGFALCSMRNANLSRYYIQTPLSDSVDQWSDIEFWDELKRRIPEAAADTLVVGDPVEKSIAPLRSFICEPMRWGNLFLVGDAAHIVPPTGAKGLNLAFADVFYLSRALERFYHGNDSSYLDNYSKTALDRVWHTARFSWNLTRLLHRFPEDEPFDQKTRESELEYLSRSERAMAAIAEQYTGLPL